MDIYILQDNRQTGPFSLVEINTMLTRRELAPSALAWFEGAEGWMPLSQLPGVVLPDEAGPMRIPKNTARNERPEQTEARRSDDDPERRFYNNVADAFGGALTSLFRPFAEQQSTLHEQSAGQAKAFLHAFLIRAAQFNDDCAMAFATSLRHSTRVDTVRGTTTKQLANDIRQEAFDALDGVLNQYEATVASLNGELRGITQQVKSVQGQSWAVDSLIDLQARGDIIVMRQDRAPREHVIAYLRVLKELPVTLIDYISAKCFGGAVDLRKQQTCVEDCLGRCEKMVDQALLMIQRFPMKDPEKAVILPRVAFRLGCGGVFCVALAIFGMAIFCSALFGSAERPPNGTDAKETAEMVEESRIDREQGFWWGLGLMAFGFGVPLINLWETNRINRARGY